MRRDRLDRFSCEQAMKRLNDYLDHELNNQDYSKVSEHLEMCENCSRRFGFEQKLLDSVKEKVGCRNLPPDFKKRLEEMLHRL